MTLEEKLKLFKQLRAEDNVLSDEEFTYEGILKRVRAEYGTALEKATASGIKMRRSDEPFPDEVKAAVFNTDTLATVGHVAFCNDHKDESAQKLLYYILNGLVAPAVTSTIFLEVDKAKTLGDPDTYRFMIEFCYFLDNSDKLEDIAALTYRHMTGTA